MSKHGYTPTIGFSRYLEFPNTCFSQISYRIGLYWIMFEFSKSNFCIFYKTNLQFELHWDKRLKPFIRFTTYKSELRYTRSVNKNDKLIWKKENYHPKNNKHFKNNKHWNGLIIFFTFMLLSACAHPQDHPVYIKNVSNFVRAIDPTIDFEILQGWVGVMQRQQLVFNPGKPTYETLKTINDNCNKKPYEITPSWPTPKEFAAAEAGDCKGFAICKYYALRAAGFTADQLNFWSGDYDGYAHLILVADLNGQQYVLDIIDPNLPLAKNYFYKHFEPAYRFNEFGWDVN
jgi:predicted transglutaminase-like cysteine proteinase